MPIRLAVLAVITILAVVVLIRRGDPVRRARVLKWTGLGVMAFITAFFGLFVVGEALTDPGGWTGLGLVAAWVVPLAALAAVAWYRPDWAAPLFAVLVAAVIGVAIWFAVNPDGWRAFEDRHGPIRTIISFVLAAAVALLGVKRTAVAGVLLLVLSVVPVVVSSLGSSLGLVSLAMVGFASVIAGVLYLWSAALANRPTPPRGRQARPEDRPMAGAL
jgi:hypothetical protein